MCIIHAITVRGCKPAQAASGGLSNGDDISVFRATNVWIDRYTVDYRTDGVIDVMEASTSVTLNHDKAVLLGNNTISPRTRTYVTVVFNCFGLVPGTVPR
jgi:hypothetical protein